MSITLLDIAKANGSDPVVGLVEEAIKAHPELSLFPARTIRGLNYKTLVCTANPTVAFRSANQGAAAVQGTFENRLVETYIMEAPIEADRAVCDRYEDGPNAYMALHARTVMEAAMQHLASCVYYGTGTGGDTKAFPGFLQAYDNTGMVVDAGGTTDSTCSSVWAVRTGDQHAKWVWGADGTLEMSDVDTVRLTDGDGNPYEGYRSVLLAYPGLQVASVYSLGRIKKLTADSGKGLTDDLIAELLEKFPVGSTPDMLLMNRRSLRQLQQSRTATNPTGAPAPFPSEAFGIPIHITDAILNTETLTL